MDNAGEFLHEASVLERETERAENSMIAVRRAYLRVPEGDREAFLVHLQAMLMYYMGRGTTRP